MSDVTRDELVAALEGLTVVINVDYRVMSRSYATGTLKYPEAVADDVLQAIAAIPRPAAPEDARWPMTRGELDRRLSLALASVMLPVSDYGTALHPGRLAVTLVRHIENQGACEAVPPPPGKPIVLHMGDPEISAIECILAVFEDLDAAATSRIARYLHSRFAGGVS